MDGIGNTKYNFFDILDSILNLTNAKEVKLKEFLKQHFASL
jgi:hypothetical protein